MHLRKEFEMPQLVSVSPELQALFKLYPNPAQDLLFIEAPASALRPLQLRLLDLQGRVHRAEILTQARETLAIEELPTGIYVLELVGESMRTWHKWIKE